MVSVDMRHDTHTDTHTHTHTHTHSRLLVNSAHVLSICSVTPGHMRARGSPSMRSVTCVRVCVRARVCRIQDRDTGKPQPVWPVYRHVRVAPLVLPR